MQAGWVKKKHMKLLPQVDERRCSKAGTNAKVKWLARWARKKVIHLMDEGTSTLCSTLGCGQGQRKINTYSSNHRCIVCRASLAFNQDCRQKILPCKAIDMRHVMTPLGQWARQITSFIICHSTFLLGCLFLATELGHSLIRDLIELSYPPSMFGNFVSSWDHTTGRCENCT